MVSEVKWANPKIFWMNSTQSTVKWQVKYTVHTRAKMKWTEDADLHKWFKDWMEETELLLNTVLSHIRNNETKLICQSMGWKGSKDPDKKDSLKTMLDTLRTGPNPNLMKLQHSHSLEPWIKVTRLLSVYIQEVRRIVDCVISTVWETYKDRLIRNSIMAGLNSTKTYQQCISKGIQSHPELVHQNMPNRGCHTQTKFKPYNQSLQTAQTVPLFTS